MTKQKLIPLTEDQQIIAKQAIFKAFFNTVNSLTMTSNDPNIVSFNVKENIEHFADIIMTDINQNIAAAIGYKHLKKEEKKKITKSKVTKKYGKKRTTTTRTTAS